MAASDGKLAAASAAVDWVLQHCESLADQSARACRIGVGSGSTMEVFMRLLDGRLQQRRPARRLQAVPSSLQALQMIERFQDTMVPVGYPKGPCGGAGCLDLSVDGADELQVLQAGDGPRLRLAMIKGRGAAMLGEKVMQQQSPQAIYIVDESKLSRRLGSLQVPLPLEVAPFALNAVERSLAARVAGAAAAVRQCAGGKAGPVVTDAGNLVVDLHIPPAHPAWDDLEGLDRTLSAISGVLEHGLFLVDAAAVVLGGPHGQAQVLCSP